MKKLEKSNKSCSNENNFKNENLPLKYQVKEILGGSISDYRFKMRKKKNTKYL